MDVDNRNWIKQFQIESEVELDFVVDQSGAYPIGMTADSPAEFKRRIIAAKISYELQLKSVDYTLNQYIEPDLYDTDDISLGRAVSHYLRVASRLLGNELLELHTQGDVLPFGVFGAELTLSKMPHALDTARVLSNRGLLLEVLPLLRLCLEMTAWANAAFFINEDDRVIDLKAQNCISSLKENYRSAGRLYGFLSQFTHWGHAVHGQFLHIEGEQVSILKASVRHRAMSLALCLVVLDVFVEVIRHIYSVKSDSLVSRVLGVGCPSLDRKPYQFVSRIADMSGLTELKEIQSFLQRDS